MPGNAARLRDPEAAGIVLGAIISRGEPAFSDALGAGLEPRHLPDERDRAIYRAMIAVVKSGKPIDLITVRRALAENGQLDSVGITYLAELGAGMPVDIGVAHYARELVHVAGARTLLHSAHVLQEAAKSGNGDFPRAIGDLEAALATYRCAGTDGSHAFEQLAEDRFRLSLPEIGTTIEADRLRREHGELQGELCVRCTLPGARTFDGALSIATFNFSSARARTERAKLLSSRAGIAEIDWSGALEELCQRVLSAEREGRSAVDLRTLERPAPDDAVRIDDIRLPRRHPAIIFGDGGSAKSYLALYVLGTLAQQGMRVGLFDWELSGEDHRDRLERLFGQDMPLISYARCERPLFYEADRLSRIVRTERLDYAVLDSVAFALDGPPESAEIAGRYFQALRKIGIGTLNIAHVTKGEGGEQKPFGSTFFHNGARATYYVKLADSSPDGRTIAIGIFNRKANLAGQYQPTGYLIRFEESRTVFRTSDPADTPELAKKLSIRQQLAYALRNGKKDLRAVADEIEADPDSVRRTVQRYRNQFTVIEGGKVALLQRDARPDKVSGQN